MRNDSLSFKIKTFSILDTGQDHTFLPAATEALNLLNAHGIPFILITNGGERSSYLEMVAIVWSELLQNLQEEKLKKTVLFL